jgi:hypothetical protein
MNSIKTCAAAIAALSTLAITPVSANGATPGASGHYEWRAAPQIGPRATAPALRRVWVSSAPEGQSQATVCRCRMIGSADPTSSMSGVQAR